MQSAVIVLESVLSVLLVMALGAVLRRRGVLNGDSSAAMGRIVADVAFPALCFDGLSRAGSDRVQAGASAIVLGFVTLALAALVGQALVRLFRVPQSVRPTVVFAIAIGNWIFLPLPVAEALYGGAGTTTVILNNVGAQVFLWTFGLVILRRGQLDVGAARMILMSPGLWATALGIGAALFGDVIPSFGPLGSMANILHTAVHFVASLTIPLVSIAIGAQLAAPREGELPRRPLVAIVVGRMLVAPLFVSGVIELAQRARVLALDEETRMTEHLIAAMPVSLSAAALAQRYGGDGALVSRAILITTLIAVLSAPLWMLALGS